MFHLIEATTFARFKQGALLGRIQQSILGKLKINLETHI